MQGVVIFANNDESGRKRWKHQFDRLHEQGAVTGEAVLCKTAAQASDALQYYARIQRPVLGFITDNLFPGEGSLEGEYLAEKVRSGKYGEALRRIPIAVASFGMPSYSSFEPPVVTLGSLHTQDIRQLLNGEVVENAYNWQQIIDFNVQMLTFALYPQEDVPLWRQCLKWLVNLITRQGKTLPEIDPRETYKQWFEALSREQRHDFMEERVTVIKDAITNAFPYASGADKTVMWPSKKQMAALQKAVAKLDGDSTYIHDDGDHNRFRLLIGGVKSRLREYLFLQNGASVVTRHF